MKYTLRVFVHQMFFVTQGETHNKPTCKFAQLCELLVVVYWILVDMIILGGEIVEKDLH